MSSFTPDNSHPGFWYLTSLLVQNCFHLLWQIPPVAYPLRMLLQSAVLRVINFEHITLVLEAFHCLFYSIQATCHLFQVSSYLCLSISALFPIKKLLENFSACSITSISTVFPGPSFPFSMKTIEPLTMSSLLMHQSQHILCLLSTDVYLIW